MDSSYKHHSADGRVLHSYTSAHEELHLQGVQSSATALPEPQLAKPVAVRLNSADSSDKTKTTDKRMALK